MIDVVNSAINHDEFISYHKSTDLKNVMADILSTYPEESFCFLNVGKLREKARIFKECFLPNNPFRVIAYSVKANPKAKILEILMKEGIEYFDCASAGEISHLLKINPNVKVLYNHPIKSISSLQYAAKCGISHYTVQSQNEIDKIIKHVLPYIKPQTTIEIAIRLRTFNEDAKINLSTKYGAIPEEVQRMLRFLNESQDLPFLPGISIHTGSQNTNPATFVKAIKAAAEIARKEGRIKTLNVGGGIPANYYKGKNFDLREYLQIISHSIEQYATDIFLDNPKIIIEPGRALIAEAVDLMIPVLSIEKGREHRSLYFNDGIYTSFSDNKIHNWEYNFQVFNKNGEEIIGEPTAHIVHGRTCDSGDTLGKFDLPANVEEGDYLRVQSAGAYMDSQGTLFNGFGLPRYVIYNL